MSLQMSKSEREVFLADLHVGVVSIPQDGMGPLTVPIWYDYTPAGEVWMITGRDSIKGRLLESATRISLCAQTEVPPYRYVSVEGRFTTRDLGAGELEAMAVRYLGDENGRAYAANAGDGAGSMVVAFVPERWLTVDYGKR